VFYEGPKLGLCFYLWIYGMFCGSQFRMGNGFSSISPKMPLVGEKKMGMGTLISELN
jgi:hypothetical protein